MRPVRRLLVAVATIAALSRPRPIGRGGLAAQGEPPRHQGVLGLHGPGRGLLHDHVLEPQGDPGRLQGHLRARARVASAGHRHHPRSAGTRRRGVRPRPPRPELGDRRGHLHGRDREARRVHRLGGRGAPGWRAEWLDVGRDLPLQPDNFYLDKTCGPSLDPIGYQCTVQHSSFRLFPAGTEVHYATTPRANVVRATITIPSGSTTGLCVWSSDVNAVCTFRTGTGSLARFHLRVVVTANADASVWYWTGMFRFVGDAGRLTRSPERRAERPRFRGRLAGADAPSAPASLTRHGTTAWWPSLVSSRTRTSTARCAAAGRRARDRGSHRGAGTLPLALPAAGLLALVLRRRRPRRPDRVGRGSELVGRHVAHRRGLAGSVRGMPCCPTQVPGRGLCMAGRRAGLPPRDLAPRPGTPEVDRPSWPVVLRPCLLEVVEHVLRAVGRPHRQQAMIVVLEAAAATHGDEPRIPDLGEDHQLPISLSCPPTVAGPAPRAARDGRSRRGSRRRSSRSSPAASQRSGRVGNTDPPRTSSLVSGGIMARPRARRTR